MHWNKQNSYNILTEKYIKKSVHLGKQEVNGIIILLRFTVDKQYMKI